MALPRIVELTDSARTGRGLLTRALPLPTGWENGITFRPVGCTIPEIRDICDFTPDDPNRVADAVTFEPVYIRESADCSTLSRVTATDRSAERLISSTEWGLGRILAEGLPGTNNPALVDAVYVEHSAATPIEDAALDAFSCLEQAIADLGYGGRAFLHTSYRGAAYLTKAGMIDSDQRSPAGNQWVISPGYPVDAERVTIWATGPVWAAVSGVETLGDPDGTERIAWRQNADESFSQRLALAAFDPCILLAATFTVPVCNGGS